MSVTGQYIRTAGRFPMETYVGDVNYMLRVVADTFRKSATCM